VIAVNLVCDWRDGAPHWIILRFANDDPRERRAIAGDPANLIAQACLDQARAQPNGHFDLDRGEQRPFVTVRSAYSIELFGTAAG
jgi:hypothetical protein